jgi:hypothetical protein
MLGLCIAYSPGLSEYLTLVRNPPEQFIAERALARGFLRFGILQRSFLFSKKILAYQHPFSRFFRWPAVCEISM